MNVARARLPWLQRGVIALLVVASVAPYPLATFTPDTARDLNAALAIADGSAFPLQGNVINGMLHLGPLWFYVLAGGVALTHSLAGTSLYVGILAALEYPLAYLTGRTLGGPSLGFWVAISAAIPGIAALEPLTWSHVNLIGTTAWLTLWCAARAWRDYDARWVLAGGAALGVALHAHPTAIVLAPALLAPVLAQFAARRRIDAAGMGALLGALLLAAAPFALTLFASPPPREAAQLVGAVASNWRINGISGARAIFDSLLLTIPDLAAGAFLHRDGVPDSAWQLALRFIWLMAFAGAVRVILRERGERRTLLLLAAAFTLVAIAFVAALRPFTPYYMARAAWAGAALFAGLGLAELARGPRMARTSAALAAALIATMHVALAAGTIERARDGWIRTPLTAGTNLKSPPREPGDAALFPALTRDAFGRALCDQASTVVVHGELATATDLGQGRNTALACGRRDLVLIGGAAPSFAHWVGLPRHVWRALDIAPARYIGTYGVSAPTMVVGPATPHRVTNGSHYPPRHFAGAPVALTIRFGAPGDSAIVVTNPLPWYLPLDEVSLARDGMAMQPAVASASIRAWRCPGCGAAVAEWTLHLRTVDPTWIDVVVMR